MSDRIVALVNGAPGDAVSIRDRGLQYGDGLFETLRCERGRVRWFERHMARLQLGCERLGLPMPERALLRFELESLARGTARGIAKLILTRGEATARGYRPSGRERPTRLVTLHPWPAPPPGEFRVGLSAVPLGVNRLLGGIKHLNRLEQVLAQQAAAGAQLDEVLMGTEAGDIICGSASNLFVAVEDRLLTPPTTDCGVAGVMRSLVIDAAARLGIPLYITPVSAALLAAARSLFLTNVRLGIQPIHWYQGRRLEADERCARLQEWIDGQFD